MTPEPKTPLGIQGEGLLREAVIDFLKRWDDPETYHRLPAVDRLRAALAAPVGSDATLRAALEATASALSDANTIITMMRQHLSHEHPDHPNCAYAVLGIMGDQTREEQAEMGLAL